MERVNFLYEYYVWGGNGMRIRVSPGRERLAAMILGVVLGALFLGSAALWYAPVGSADFHMLPAG